MPDNHIYHSTKILSKIQQKSKWKTVGKFPQFSLTPPFPPHSPNLPLTPQGVWRCQRPLPVLWQCHTSIPSLIPTQNQTFQQFLNFSKSFIHSNPTLHPPSPFPHPSFILTSQLPKHFQNAANTLDTYFLTISFVITDLLQVSVHFSFFFPQKHFSEKKKLGKNENKKMNSQVNFDFSNFGDDSTKSRIAYR